ncbi:uncharacterized protein LOC143254912 [Tachypleus tridentatus]|uniref:uncharacterized protein LOC143254912 n=1 Tax=Tachypleus tridentatus TaxID=6853 RepID=UPI003FD4D1C0
MLSEIASRSCKHSSVSFCYACGHFIKTRVKKCSVTASTKMYEAYKTYFDMPIGDQDKPWAHFTCENCKKTLEGWYRGEKSVMKFAIPRVWREPTDHSVLLLHGGPFQTSGWQECFSYHVSRPSIIHHSSATLP